ncbi:MAG: sensor histidine kinase, partial [Spirochaetaceae bacterium]
LLEEKQLLLRETHHRIKNNMHVIQSLLSLEAHSLIDPTSQRVLQGAAGKIRSMMVLYDRLYRSETHGEATLRDFLPPLVEQIVDIFSAAGKVDTQLELDDISLRDDQLSAIGILVNELISNSMKYAFAETEAPRITISARKDGDVIVLTYGDNGSGIPESVTIGDATDETAGFGMQLIGALADQLNAIVRVERDSGTRIVLEFAA